MGHGGTFLPRLFPIDRYRRKRRDHELMVELEVLEPQRRGIGAERLAGRGGGGPGRRVHAVEDQAAALGALRPQLVAFYAAALAVVAAGPGLEVAAAARGPADGGAGAAAVDGVPEAVLGRLQATLDAGATALGLGADGTDRGAALPHGGWRVEAEAETKRRRARLEQRNSGHKAGDH